MGLNVANNDLTLAEVGRSERATPAKGSADLAAEALDRASRRAFGFEPPDLSAAPAWPDVARRLIELELAGAADELTWARYDRSS